MSARENILGRIRTSLGRMPGEGIAPRPNFELQIPSVPDRVATFCERFEALAGKPHLAANPSAALELVNTIRNGRSTVAADHPLLAETGILGLDGVEHSFPDAAALRQACARCDIGITSATYALADTGTLVMFSKPGEPRLLSLLPPIHAALVPASSILAGLEDLLARVADPAAYSSSMVLITGPSRTADIEQILIRGVHGPGEIHAVVLTYC
jgi:L-lactate dehydrogenase complex protein LldG